MLSIRSMQPQVLTAATPILNPKIKDPRSSQLPVCHNNTEPSTLDPGSSQLPHQYWSQRPHLALSPSCFCLHVRRRERGGRAVCRNHTEVLSVTKGCLTLWFARPAAAAAGACGRELREDTAKSTLPMCPCYKIPIKIRPGYYLQKWQLVQVVQLESCTSLHRGPRSSPLGYFVRGSNDIRAASCLTL